MMIRFCCSLSLLFFSFSQLLGQQTLQSFDFEAAWEWRELEEIGGYWSFQDAVHREINMAQPFWTASVPASGAGQVSLRIEQAQYQSLDKKAQAKLLPWLKEGIAEEHIVEGYTTQRRGQYRAKIALCPLRRNPQTGQIEGLVKAKISVQWQRDEKLRKTTRKSFATNSKLSNGQIYKIAVNQSGVYQLAYSDLQNLGLDVDNIDPRNIQLLGQNAKQLPYLLDQNRPDDLQEIPIRIEGQDDGRFDSQDRILFYAQGPQYYRYDTASKRYLLQKHEFSANMHYFIKVANSPGLRISQTQLTGNPDYSTTSYDALARYEVDRLSIMEEAFALPASGLLWFGESFRLNRQQSFTITMPQRIPTEPLRISSSFAVRATSSSALSLECNGLPVHSRSNIAAISLSTYQLYARAVDQSTEILIPNGGDQLSINVSYSNAASNAEAWLDYIEAQGRATLRVQGQLLFSDARSLGANIARYTLQTNQTASFVWDVSNLQAIQAYTLDALGRFSAPADTLRWFIACDGSSFLSPQLLGAVPNQNLHGIQNVPDMLIVYHRDFAGATQSLAAQRQSYSNLNVLTVDVEQIYNEFSSGNVDISAIRNFAKMLYDRSGSAGELRYLLLMGKGSFDALNKKGRPNNPQFIPLFITEESLNPLTTFTTDDYFAMLDDGEGNIALDSDLDISVGRLPAASASEANLMVDKILQYENNPQHYRDWRNRMVFFADDEDGNIHKRDVDSIAAFTQRLDSNYLIKKVYIDAFPEVSTAAGNRYPEAKDALLNELFQGVLVFNYMGHGGVTGLTQEQVFTTTEINNMRNADRLPLFVTATCSFAPLDDPSILSAGELLMLNPQGGAMALLTTVRVVFANANERLTRKTFEYMFNSYQGRKPTLGEILMQAKNDVGLLSAFNSRKYMLLGDPAMRLGYPQHRVVPTSFNGQPLTWLGDTLQALRRITIAGEIQDQNGNLLNNFNGTVYPRIYDKIDSLQTLGNHIPSGPFSYTSQTKLIFRGRATVQNGRFQFSFIVPQSINYILGPGRLSFYAENGATEDAAGVHLGTLVGGSYLNAEGDDVPPQVEVFMNDESFVSGGITDNNPQLYIRLYDESGINITGNTIGQDLSSEVEPFGQGTKMSYTLNNFYESEKDDFTRGKVLYPLRDLPDGKHAVRAEAWDVYGNRGQGETDFIVSSSAELALRQVLNYPNPFTTETRFQFEHNYPNQALLVRIQVFTVAGRLVKSIEETVLSEGYRVTDIPWDGLDEYGDVLARGVYIYKVTIQAEADAEAQTSAFQKLVILR